MLTDQEKEAALLTRERARAALQTGDLTSFQEIVNTSLRTLGDRLEEIRKEGSLSDDSTAYDAAARFVTEQGFAFHQQHQAYVGSPIQGESVRIGGGPLYPLPIILGMVARGEVAAVDVHDWGLGDPPQPDVLDVHLHLHPEAAAALATELYGNQHPAGLLWISLSRTARTEPISETARRLSREPVFPTREEVNDLLRAVDAYNATHAPPISITIGR